MTDLPEIFGFAKEVQRTIGPIPSKKSENRYR